MTADNVVFLSHAQTDESAARALKHWIEDGLRDLGEVFVSSDWESIELGEAWFDAITAALNRCRLGLILVTENSIGRQWVNFELGGLQLLGKSVIPICVAPINKGSLPSPLDRLQACQWEQPQDRIALLKAVARSLSLPERFTERLSEVTENPALVIRREEPLVPLQPPVRKAPLDRLFEIFDTRDRWTTIVYTCRTTFTGEVCPALPGQQQVRKAVCAHVPVDEMQTFCMAVNHLIPRDTRRSEDDIVDLVLCSKEAEDLAHRRVPPRLLEAPYLFERDLVIIGENNFSTLLLDRMRAFLPWERTVEWVTEQWETKGRPSVSVQLAPHALVDTRAGQVKRVGKGGAMLGLFPNPFNVRKRVLVLFGCHREGQFTMEGWLAGRDAGNVLDSVAAAMDVTRQRSYALQIVVDRAGRVLDDDYAEAARSESSAIKNVNDDDQPFWLMRLGAADSMDQVEANPDCAAGREMYDLSLLARIEPEAQALLRRALESHVPMPDMYWEDEQCDLGFHITLFEFCTHDAPSPELISTIERVLPDLVHELSASSLTEAPRRTRATIRGIDLMARATLALIEFGDGERDPRWLQSARLWCARNLRRSCAEAGVRAQLFNRQRTPFPPHVTLCRFSQAPDAARQQALRALAAEMRVAEITSIPIQTLTVAVARRRPYRDITTVAEVALAPPV